MHPTMTRRDGRTGHSEGCVESLCCCLVRGVLNRPRRRRNRVGLVPRYLISFDDGAMDHLGDDLEDVGEAAHRVLREAKAANVWVTGGGLRRQKATIVDPSGSVRLGDFPERKAVLGGFVIVEVATHDAALEWAGRFATACRCAQEVRLIMDDPEV